MRTALFLVCAAALTTRASAYIHVPPQTLKAMCAESSQIRALTVTKRDGTTGVVVFEVAEVLRAEPPSAVPATRLVVRPDATGAKGVFDKLAVGRTVVLFSKEDGTGKTARGYGYVFVDEAAFSVDYNGPGEFWLFLRAEPSLSVVYHGPSAKLPGLTKAVRAGDPVAVPTRAAAGADDYSLRGLLVEEARRKNSPRYPKTPLPTAWGKPAKGLQAGVRINPAAEVAGADRVLEVVVRNAGGKPVRFTHLQLGFGGASADGVVTGRAEEYASRFMPKGSRSAAYVSPGDAYVVADVPVFPAGERKDWPLPRLHLRPGENRVGMEGVVVRLGSGKQGEDVELSTGYLDVVGPSGTK